MQTTYAASTGKTADSDFILTNRTCAIAGGRASTPPIPVLCFQRTSIFLYSLLKSAANAVLELLSAVIAIAHVLFISIKLLSVSFVKLESLPPLLGEKDPSTSPDITLKLDAGMSCCPSWAAQEGSSLSFVMYLLFSGSTS